MKLLSLSLLLVLSLNSYAKGYESLFQNMPMNASDFMVGKVKGIELSTKEKQVFTGGDIVGNGQVSPIQMQDIFIIPQEAQELNEELKNLLEEYNLQEEVFRGGDIVGNGSGHGETEVEFFIAQLPFNIKAALKQKTVRFNETEEKVLTQILENVEVKAPTVFLVSGEESTEFFNEIGVDRSERIAKTGFSPEFPIYVNQALIEKVIHEKPLYWVSLLIHELGHQAGVANHRFLDRLAGKVQLVLSLGKDNLQYPMNSDDTLNIQIVNHYFREAVADVYITYNGELVAINDWDVEKLKEGCGDLEFAGLQVINMHWKDYSQPNDKGEVLLKMGAWGQIKCKDTTGAIYNTMLRDLEVSIYSRPEGLTVATLIE